MVLMILIKYFLLFNYSFLLILDISQLFSVLQADLINIHQQYALALFSKKKKKTSLSYKTLG